MVEDKIEKMIVVGMEEISDSRFPDMESVANKIVPYIDSKYRTIPDRENRALMGSSGGGTDSLLTGLYYSEKFSVIAALSLPPALHVLDYVNKYSKKDLKIWIDNGTDEEFFIVIIM